jgi:Uma2 family endonuclease
MTAEEYLDLGETEERYELIDGVIRTSPGPFPDHQDVVMEISGQIWHFLRTNPVGRVRTDLDVCVRKGTPGHDLVYQPDVVFIRDQRLASQRRRIVEPPDVIVEVASKSTRRFDRETKKADYERFGVKEYWIIDPEQDSFAFFRLQDGCYVAIPPEGDSYHSMAIPGFVLDLARIKEAFHLE